MISLFQTFVITYLDNWNDLCFPNYPARPFPGHFPTLSVHNPSASVKSNPLAGHTSPLWLVPLSTLSVSPPPTPSESDRFALGKLFAVHQVISFSRASVQIPPSVWSAFTSFVYWETPIYLAGDTLLCSHLHDPIPVACFYRVFYGMYWILFYGFSNLCVLFAYGNFILQFLCILNYNSNIKDKMTRNKQNEKWKCFYMYLYIYFMKKFYIYYQGLKRRHEQMERHTVFSYRKIQYHIHFS